jgi:hypothetical protein
MGVAALVAARDITGCTIKEAYHDLLAALLIRLEEREEQYRVYKEEGGTETGTTFYRTLGFVYNLLTEGQPTGIYVNMVDIFELAKGYDDISKVLKRAEEVLLKVRLNDQSVYSPSNKNYKEDALGEDEAYYIRDNVAYLMKQCK